MQNMVERTLPLNGMLVLDLSRMLPGAVLARQLLDLGARVIKVEAPGTGDPMRHLPPLVDGVGAGFSDFMRGAESVALNLADLEDAEIMRAIAQRADVIVESFRPGTLEKWGLGVESLTGENPTLVWCALSSYGHKGEKADQVGHDLNFTAESGALRLMSHDGIPLIQLADVSAGMLACSAILSALFMREKTGKGSVIDQPLSLGVVPYITWIMAEGAAGDGGVIRPMLGGQSPCYRCYRCADGPEIAVAAIEPKFWTLIVKLLGLEHLDGMGMVSGEQAKSVSGQVAEVFLQHPQSYWLSLARKHSLPISEVMDQDSVFTASSTTSSLTGTYIPSLGHRPHRPAPALGEHTDSVLKEFAE